MATGLCKAIASEACRGRLAMPRPRTRFPLEACAKFDVNALRLRAFVRTVATITYSSGLHVRIVAKAEADSGWLELAFEGRTQRIRLEGRPRRFGGHQWYARCPSTGRRVSTLWKPPGPCGFACRRAWRNAAYLTQFQDPAGRAWTKKRRIARRLGSTDPSDYEFPPKPRWMRWTTYDRHADRFEEAENAIQSACAAALQRLLGTGWSDLIAR